eukprot:m.78835 g.78835  ORF g.78835 m.78835 type:complete len:245 (-) comp25158_c0_seq3:169-903(-)
MNRRGRGIAGIKKQDGVKAAATAKGEQMATLEMATVSKQMTSFRESLQKFALKHSKNVSKDPAFRRDFQRMCDVVGVDALASQKGFWAGMFGMGDFYYKLGVQIVQVCLIEREKNGGIIAMEELMQRLEERRPGQLDKLDEDDIVRAIAKLKALGNGFQIYERGGKKVVQSVPTELSQDDTAVLEIVAATGRTCVSELQQQLSWDSDRAQGVLEHMVKEGMAWVDAQTGQDHSDYWFPGLVSNM